MTTLKRLLITPGEPAGIGPDVTLQIAQQSWPAELIVVADPDLMITRANQLGLPIQLIEADLSSPAEAHKPGRLKIIPVALKAPAKNGVLDKRNAAYVLETLETAAKYCSGKAADAIVTGPVHKGIMNAADISFLGHTEFFADYCGVSRTVMLFVVDNMKVALATTHLQLKQVPLSLTPELLTSVITILHTGLQTTFKLHDPRIAVCGLNPHAGEDGYLGREEIDTITPALEALRERGMKLTGPLPADTAFTPHHLSNTDAILAMYHDQALPVVKFAGFDHAVNVTLGLPFVRTSVDHGTAIDLAGTGKAHAGSMAAAIATAIQP